MNAEERETAAIGVGWAERSEPHQNAAGACMVGLAPLGPPYKTIAARGGCIFAAADLS